MRHRLTQNPTTRTRLTASKVNPWTAMDPVLNDLIQAYWGKETDPKTWDETREALVGQGINPDDWRPPVRERTAATLSFPRPGTGKKPVAYDLPANAALHTGMVGPIRIGNVQIVEQGQAVRIAGEVRITPIGWYGISPDAKYAVLVGLVLNDVQVNRADKYIQVTGIGQYEITTYTGEVEPMDFRVNGIITASHDLASTMADADMAGQARIAAATGLYGFPASIEKTAGVANRRLARVAAMIARAAMRKDAGVVDFLKVHAKREGSRPAKVLLAALKETLPRVAAAAEVGMYGHKARTAQIGIQACADVRLEAGRIAAELHGRKGSEHARITAFLKSHSAKGKCAYSGMILSCYPDGPVADVPADAAPPRLASAPPSTVRGWLTASYGGLEDRLAEVPDPKRVASDLQRTLAGLKGIEDTPGIHIQGLIKALSSAASAKTEKDLDANLKEAAGIAQTLLKALSTAQQSLADMGADDLGEDDREVAADAIRNGKTLVRKIIHEIGNV